MHIDILRKKIAKGQYELTQHAKDEAANDGLDIADIETVILRGRILWTLTGDPRGNRYVVFGMTKNKQEVEVVCRILPSGKMRIITVYLKG